MATVALFEKVGVVAAVLVVPNVTAGDSLVIAFGSMSIAIGALVGAVRHRRMHD